MLAATKLRVPVWRPVSEHGRADLVLEIGGQLWRVQVKWGRLSPGGDVVIVSLRTARCTPRGHVFRTYTEDEVDLFGVYCGDLDRCFLLPGQLFADRTVVYLRLTPASNGQRACINLAGDFTFDGAVAQLARATRWQRVGQGFESPQLHSNSRNPALTIGADSCRVSFGYWLDRVDAGEDLVVTRREADDQAHDGYAGLGAAVRRTRASAPAAPDSPVGIRVRVAVTPTVRGLTQTEPRSRGPALRPRAPPAGPCRRSGG